MREQKVYQSFSYLAMLDQPVRFAQLRLQLQDNIFLRLTSFLMLLSPSA